MEQPIKPDQSDCCNSGCSPCILDVYEEQLKKFRDSSKCKSQPIGNCLSLTSYSVFKLVDFKSHTKDCHFFTFQFVKPEKCRQNTCSDVVYEPGQHLLFKGTIHGEINQKAYTPIYIENQASDCFTVLVKLYENGRMSNIFKRLRVGMETLWRGPYGDYKINYEQNHMLFIAQGTGIAPFYSILTNMLDNQECHTFLSLFFCCNENNILLRNELYQLKQFWNFQYELFISVQNRDGFEKKYAENVNFRRIAAEDIHRYLKLVKGNLKVLVCGAHSFCDNIKHDLLQCNVPDEDIIIF